MNLTIEPFLLNIVLRDKQYIFNVTQSYLSESIEIFTLTFSERSIQMQSNRPYIRGLNLNKKRIQWKAINGKVKYQSSLEQIKEELENYIKRIERPPFNRG